MAHVKDLVLRTLRSRTHYFADSDESHLLREHF